MNIETIAPSDKSLRAAIVLAMPHSLVVGAWVPWTDWKPEGVAHYLGDLARTNRLGLQSLSSWAEDSQLVVEANDSRALLKEIGGNLVVALVFGQSTPLGMVRIEMREFVERLQKRL